MTGLTVRYRTTPIRTTAGPALLVHPRNREIPAVFITAHALQRLSVRGGGTVHKVIRSVVQYLAEEPVSKPTALIAPDLTVIVEPASGRRVAVVTVGQFRWTKRGTARVHLQRKRSA